MKQLSFLPMLIVPLFPLAIADIIPIQYCVSACNVALSYVTFDETASQDQGYYGTLCTNVLVTHSTFFCAAIYCSPAEITAGFNAENSSCIANSLDLPSYVDFIKNVNSDHLASIPRVDALNASVKRFDYAVVPSQSYFKSAYDTTAAYSNNILYSNNFSWTLYGFWGLVVLVGILNRAISLVRAHHVKHKNIDLESLSTRNSGFIAKTHTWIRRTLILPATFNGRCAQPYGWLTLPPRLESILLLLYILINIIFCLPGYYTFNGNLYWSEIRQQLNRYIADRTGLLALANLPIVWIFSTRNDPLLWMTGWSYAMYSRFHRWAAILATAEAVAHSVCFSLDSYFYGQGDYAFEWTQQYWYCGAIATIAMSLSCSLSVYWFRARLYDLFLVIHISFGVMVLVGVFYHLKIYDGEYNGFIWASVAVWSLDRVIRGVRIAYLSLYPISRGGKALATYDADADIIHLDVTTFFNNQAPSPGLYYYIYEPGTLRGHENHPFTLCYWSPPVDTLTDVDTDTDANADAEKSPATPNNPNALSALPIKELYISTTTTPSTPTLSSPATSIDPSTTDQHHPPPKATFLIRPWTGFTARLRNRITAHQSARQGPSPAPLALPLLLEGPYGTPLHAQLRACARTLLVVGGTGVSVAIAHLHALLAAQPAAGPPRMVKLVWAVRQPELVRAVLAAELAGAVGCEGVRVEVFLTGVEGDVKGRGESEGEGEGEGVKWFSGRPDVEAVVSGMREEAVGRLGVVCCGPASMADECRRAVVRCLGEPGPEIEFFDEAFSW